MPLNQRALRLAVAKNPNAQKVLVRQVRPLIKAEFEDVKDEFLQEFDEDDVTQEIAAGPEAHSSQPALGEGNLFSLLGFYAEQKPIEALREYLHDNVVLYKTGAGKVKGTHIVFSTQVLAPTEDEVNAVVAAHPETALEWTTRSFTDLLARGIDGLPNYLFDLTRDFSHIPSRSGPAIQSKQKQTNTKMPANKYIERILKKLSQLVKPVRH